MSLKLINEIVETLNIGDVVKVTWKNDTHYTFKVGEKPFVAKTTGEKPFEIKGGMYVKLHSDTGSILGKTDEMKKVEVISRYPKVVSEYKDTVKR